MLYIMGCYGPFEKLSKDLRRFALKNRDFLTPIRNLKKNILPMISATAALCLFTAPSKLSLLVTAAVFAAALWSAFADCIKPPAVSSTEKKAAGMLALLTVLLGLGCFMKAWAPVGILKAVASALHISVSVLLGVLGGAGGLAGIYWVYSLFCRGIAYAGTMVETHHLKDRIPELKHNLKQNWYLPLSALSYFALSLIPSGGSLPALLAAAAIWILVSAVTEPLHRQMKNTSLWIRALSILSAAGICWAAFDGSQASWSVSARQLSDFASVADAVPAVIWGILAVLAIPFVCVCLTFFWTKLAEIVKETAVFQKMGKAEALIWGLLLATMLVFMAVCFLQSDAFYGTEFDFDILYTSDSPTLVKDNIYLAFNHPENDLRQPLFAVFAAPFAGLPYFLGRILGVSAPVQAVFTNSVQVMLLFAACWLMADLLKLNKAGRFGFLLVNCFTYNQLLFVLMMEQYIVAYFWLIFCVYLIVRDRCEHHLALWGAGGSLLTSLAVTPLMSHKNPLSDWKGWFVDMVRCGVEFAAVMLAFGRLDVILNLTGKVSSLSRFTGRELTLLDKIFQYTAFVHDCFAAPSAGISDAVTEHISWQLSMPEAIHPAGVVILILAVISALWNRKKKSSLIAGCWVLFSLVMLLGLGWGTQENGLILYALYFGWAFLILLVQLVEKIGQILRIPALLPAVCVIAAAGLAAVNIPGILEMVRFAIANFPI